MCQLCGGVPGCVGACPNNGEPKFIARCDFCDEYIIKGDSYYHVTDRCICLDCIDEYLIEGEE